MQRPWQVYDLLLDIVPDDTMIEEISMGMTWTMCRANSRLGLAMSPQNGVRTLSWSGSLRGRSARELATWVREWDPYKSTVGMATINATIYHDDQLLTRLHPVMSGESANLAVFEHFYPQLSGKKVVVVGRYPGMDEVLKGIDVTVLERQPGAHDLPDTAAEYILGEADWVFLTATSLINKTFPRLAELARNSNLVLMGPTTPWLTELSEFGVDYLAGVRVHDAASVAQTIAEGGGTRLFESGLEYCIADLGASEMDWIKTAISDTVTRREGIKEEMDRWFSDNQKGRFPRQSELLTLDDQLSSLDSQFKRLWDARH
jgi:uncharacterized protein (DUF4213/DUF364 family)